MARGGGECAKGGAQYCKGWLAGWVEFGSLITSREAVAAVQAPTLSNEMHDKLVVAGPAPAIIAPTATLV